MLKTYYRNKILKIRQNLFNKKKKIDYKQIVTLIKNTKKKSPIIGGYYPVNFEIDCLNILYKLEKANNKIALPVIKKNKAMEFYRYSFNDPLNLNIYGIPEPISKKMVTPDILFVPLVAFDDRLFRIGYGGGYYDRYLNKLKKRKNFISIGFAASFQKIKRIQTNKYDKKLNIIITEKKIYT